MTEVLAEQLKDFLFILRTGSRRTTLASVCLNLDSSAGMYWRGNQKATTLLCSVS